MTGGRNIDRSIRDWLADDTDILPDRVLDAVVAELPVTRQERGRLAWLPTLAPIRFAAMAAVLVAAVAVGLAFLGSPGGIGGPRPTAPAPASPVTVSPSPSPALTATALPTPNVAPGYGTTPPGWPTSRPWVQAPPLPAPAGDPLPADLVGRVYNTNPLETQESQALVLTLRGADDPHCMAMYGDATISTCFTILWTPNYPLHAQDMGVRGPARIVDGNLVLAFAIVPFDPVCEGTSSTYTISEDGWTLQGVDVPSCSFQGFVRH
jgi:hypothetical protein